MAFVGEVDLHRPAVELDDQALALALLKLFHQTQSSTGPQGQRVAGRAGEESDAHRTVRPGGDLLAGHDGLAGNGGDPGDPTVTLTPGSERAEALSG